MSNINNGIDIIYGNSSSTEYDVMCVQSVGSTTRSNNTENWSAITSTNLSNNIFNFHGIKADSPLEFDLILVNRDGTYMDNYKVRSLKKWLMKNKRQWLNIDQEDLANTMFYCICNSCELVDIGKYTGALRCNFVTDSPFAWSELKTKEYTTSSNTLNFTLNPYFDVDEYIVYPNLTIQCLGNGNISIVNSTTNETCAITGCTTGEVISLECGADKISSSTDRNLMSSWNKNTISIVENLNSFVLTGNFKLKMEYRLPMRIGA